MGSVENVSYLQGLMLADPMKDKETITIDILVGLDYYWQLVTGEVVRRGYGPEGTATVLMIQSLASTTLDQENS